MNDEAGSARINALVIKAGHVGPHLLAHHMLGVAVLKIAQISYTEYDPGPGANGKYVMSFTHTRLSWVGRGWASSRLEAQRRPWIKSMVRGTNDLGC